MREVCISSLLHTAGPMDLSNAQVVATAKVNALIDDFSHGLRDWYQLNAGNLTHQQSWTRKITDPMYRGAETHLDDAQHQPADFRDERK